MMQAIVSNDVQMEEHTKRGLTLATLNDLLGGGLTDQEIIYAVSFLVQSQEPDRNTWLQTYTGKAFYPFAPRLADIEIVDIAWALSMTCRYTGHTKKFYSVAEHCVLLSYVAPTEHAYSVLMHDAAEAYFGDLSRPVKRNLPNYRRWESELMAVIAKKFKVPWPEPECVGKLDTAILTDERRALLGKPPMPWGTDTIPLGVTIYNWSPEVAFLKFLDRFNDLSQNYTTEGSEAWTRS